ncbi:hypothetical protein [Pseudomonas zhanjiangensis]|uniref:Uncharacterized protein n=1 Tax=Pseudomonas zhanjiangensis TaxID=3239015 RepID=A0ABV3YRX1_9PSED
MKRYPLLVGALLTSLLPAAGLAKDKAPFTDSFPLAQCALSSVGSNPYFPLQPGRMARFNNFRCVAEGDCDEAEELVISVLEETREVTLLLDGVETTVATRIVEEVEMVDGQLAEISRNYFAECAATQDVYYFGEEVDLYEDGQLVGHEGEWLAGVDAARPGIIMPGGAFLLGARYFQEVAPGVALDRATHVASGLAVAVPAGAMENCVEVEETTPLDKKAVSTKRYCPGTGLVFDDGLELEFVSEP